MSRYFEKKIVTQVVEDALKAGYEIEVDDGEEDYPVSVNKEEILENLFNLDEAHIFLHKDGKRIGWVFFVFGNGADVVSDYTVNLEGLLAEANKMADEFSA